MLQELSNGSGSGMEVKQSNSNDSPPFNTLPSELVRVIAA
ncbi:unnamed protein product, partial [Allacma fusca]